MDAPLLIRVVGGILGFWVCFFLGSRTAYHRSTRWLRWSFVFLGLHFLFATLESPLGLLEPAVIPLLRSISGLIALAFWHGWLVGVRGLTRTEGIVRKVHLGIALNYALFAVVIGLIPGDVTFAVPTVQPWVAPLLIGVYLGGVLLHAWGMTWRLYRREALPLERIVSRRLLIATSMVSVSVIAVAAASALKQAQPEASAWIEQVGYALLCCGIVVMGYGALTYVQRHMGRNSGRDYLASGFASLGIVAVYESVLIMFRSVTLKVLPAHQALVLGIVLIPVIIATHFGFDQLRDMLDWLRVGDAERRVRSMLRAITRQIGSEKPRNEVISDVLQSLAQGLRAECVAVFWFTTNEAHLLAAYGQKPDASVQADVLRAPRLQPFHQLAGYDLLLPLYVGRKQHGALLIGGQSRRKRMPDEQAQLEVIGLLLAHYIERTESEPITVPQHIHRLEQQARDVQQMHDALDRLHRPPVFITTLGPFRVEVNGEEVSYKGRLGRHMLNGMLMYLVANVEKRIPRDTLIEIAGDHRRRRKPGVRSDLPNSSHYISGLRQMLERWGMADALDITDTTVTLKRHPSWTTDTDQVIALYRRAEQDITAGRMRSAIALLEEALSLFHGDYLQEFDAAEYRIDHEVHRWECERSMIEQRLLSIYLNIPDLTDADRQRMSRLADALLTRSQGDSDVVNLVRRIAQRCGNHRLLQQCAASDIGDNLE